VIARVWAALRALLPLAPLVAVSLAVPARGALATGRADIHPPASPADLRTLTLVSPALGGATHVRVLLPDGYAASRRRYPVLYLLHGYTDSYLSWSTRSDVVAYARRLPLIVVMPDGANGWYTDPAGAGPRWEDYDVGELIPYVDAHYRTVPRRAGRDVAGLSMGGLGAFDLAARHPDLFVAAASFSGALDLAALEAPADRFLFPTLSFFGDPRAEGWRWDGHNPVALASNLRGLRLYLASGDGQPGPLDGARLGGGADPIERYAHGALVDMAAALRGAGVPATVEDYGPGTHSWPYWQRDLHRALPLILGAFAHPPAAPLPWSYRMTDDRAAVWGYHVARIGGRHGWLALRDVSRAGFTAAGRGLLTVTTAPLYRPRAPYTLTVAGAPRRRTRQRADRAGRLRLTFTLAGPAAPQRVSITRALQGAPIARAPQRVSITRAPQRAPITRAA